MNIQFFEKVESVWLPVVAGYGINNTLEDSPFEWEESAFNFVRAEARRRGKTVTMRAVYYGRCIEITAHNVSCLSVPLLGSWKPVEL